MTDPQTEKKMPNQLQEKVMPNQQQENVPPPLFAVVTVVYNHCEGIEETIQSVLNQTYPSIHYLIIDGGSTDGTTEIIQQYASRLHFWSSEPDGGIYDAMNKALERCSGDYVLFMNSGDRFYSNDTVQQLAGQSAGEDLLYGDTLLKTKDRLQLSKSKPCERIGYGMPFCHQSVAAHRRLFAHRRFDTRYRYAADFAFFVEASVAGKLSYRQLPVPVAIYDNTGLSMSLEAAKEQADIIGRYYGWSVAALYQALRYRYYRFTAGVKRLLPARVLKTLLTIKNN